MTSNKVIDLFSGTASATAAFEESSDWEVFRVEKDPELVEEYGAELQADVLEVSPGDLPDPDVVWASPPCTDFSIACAHKKWTEDKLPRESSVAHSVKLVYRTLWLVNELSPDYWFLENPRGMLRNVMPFGPEGTVTYCQYGFDWMKPTDLYGEHPESMTYRSCRNMDNCHLHNPSSRDGEYSGEFRDKTESVSAFHQSTSGGSELRARVPFDLSKAVLESVKNPGSSMRQSSVKEVSGR